MAVKCPATVAHRNLAHGLLRHPSRALYGGEMKGQVPGGAMASSQEHVVAVP